MRFAEVFLRLGVALVAWMLIYAHTLWLAALPEIGCGPDGAEMHALLLGIAPLTLLAIVMIRVSRPLSDIHSMLRWLGVPVLLLAAFCLKAVWQVADTVNVSGESLCAAGASPAWASYWAPAQMIVVALLIVVVLANLRSRPHAK